MHGTLGQSGLQWIHVYMIISESMIIMHLSIVCPPIPPGAKVHGGWVGIWHTSSVVLAPPLGETNIDKSRDELSACMAAAQVHGDLPHTSGHILVSYPYHSTIFAPAAGQWGRWGKLTIDRCITFTLSSKVRETFLNGYSCARLGQKTMNSKTSRMVSVATAILKDEDVAMVDKATKHVG